MVASNPAQLRAERERPKKAGLVKVRFTIALLATLCPVVCYISRQNLPFAIVSMVADEAASSPTQAFSSPANDNDDDDAHLARLILGSNASTLTTFYVDGQRRQSNSTRRRSDNNQQERNHASACPAPASASAGGQLEDDAAAAIPSTKGYGPKYAWSADERGILLGAFFYTYVLFQIPGARLAERIGAKWILVAATSGSALFSLLSPWAASCHVHLLSLIRVLMGACQAALYPTCYVLYAKWLPPIERSQALPILCVGAYAGSIVASSLTGYFSEQPRLGWQYAFYLPGALCALWTLAWVLLAANEPRQHPSISLEELAYIEARMERTASSAPALGDLEGGGGATATATAAATATASVRPEISWRKLFESRSIWAMMAAFFASNWSFTIVLLLIPTYLNNILHVSPLNSGLINSVIYVLYCVASPLVGSGSTMMVETRACGLSRLNIRKLFQTTALFGQALCFVALPLLGCNQQHVFAALFVQIVFFSFVNGGEVQLPTELSVDFAGTIYALGNCVGSSTGFIVPLVHSQIVRDVNDRQQWELYFYLAAAISALGGLIFLLFGGNQLQDFSRTLSESQADICKLTGVLDCASFNGPALANQTDELAATAGRQRRRNSADKQQRRPGSEN